MGQQVRVDRELITRYQGQESSTITTSTQGIYEQSAVQVHPIGQRMVVDDMVFKYCKARTAPTEAQNPRANRAVVYTHQYQTASVVVAADVGDTLLTATVADVAAGNYENGYIIDQPTASWTQNNKLRIADNTTTQFKLKDPLIVAIADTANLYFSKNMYYDVGRTQTSGTDYSHRWDRSFVAVPLLHITSAYYFWGQTWGPTCIQFQSSTYAPGVHAGYGIYGTRLVFFDHFGGAYLGGASGDGSPFSGGNGVQACGFVIPDTWISGYGGWSILIFLQITPW